MGYRKIPNLYQVPELLLALKGNNVYALEKIHSTSAHVAWDGSALKFFSGGEKHDKFVNIFEPGLEGRFRFLFGEAKACIYGEAYGGKQQGMSSVYGPMLKFCAFEVELDGEWQSVGKAEALANEVGFEFVDYTLGPCDLAFLDYERDRPSVQAVRNGIAGDQPRKGIVIRPTSELLICKDLTIKAFYKGHPDDETRVMAKHKTEAQSETRTLRKVVDLSEIQKIEDANKIADEYVTMNRLGHVLDGLRAGKYGEPIDPKDLCDTKRVIDAMLKDCQDESKDEVMWSPAANRAVCTAAAKLWKNKVRSEVNNVTS